jgi:predicted membrane protein
MDRLTAAAARPRPTATLIAAWIMTFIVLVAALGTVIAWRDPIIRIWPPSSRILGQISSVTPASAVAKE